VCCSATVDGKHQMIDDLANPKWLLRGAVVCCAPVPYVLWHTRPDKSRQNFLEDSGDCPEQWI
jgi:hypothetical protein